MSRIDKVGFEIEGGWDGKKGVSPFSDISLIADHSINGQTRAGAPAIAAVHVGEAVSKPFPYDPKEPWIEWLSSHWPNAVPPHRTNRTCGFHIHLSTKSMKDYSLLASKSFLMELKETMEAEGKAIKLPKKHVFWERILGFNTFCPLDFDPAEQMKVSRKGGRNRYGWLNFSWTLHKTMEFRALPTFRDAAVALRFTLAYLQFVEEWLEANQTLSLRREASLSL